jgi:hypothetical protein
MCYSHVVPDDQLVRDVLGQQNLGPASLGD